MDEPHFTIRKTTRFIEEDTPDAHVYHCACPQCQAKKQGDQHANFALGMGVAVAIVMVLSLVIVLLK